MNIIDNLLIEEAVRDAEANGGIVKARASLNKDYGRMGKGNMTNPSSGSGQLNYVEETEEGFAGLEAPLGM